MAVFWKLAAFVADPSRAFVQIINLKAAHLKSGVFADSHRLLFTHSGLISEQRKLLNKQSGELHLKGSCDVSV